jgi:hypothetical protein
MAFSLMLRQHGKLDRPGIHGLGNLFEHVVSRLRIPLTALRQNFSLVKDNIWRKFDFRGRLAIEHDRNKVLSDPEEMWQGAIQKMLP